MIYNSNLTQLAASKELLTQLTGFAQLKHSKHLVKPPISAVRESRTASNIPWIGYDQNTQTKLILNIAGPHGSHLTHAECHPSIAGFYAYLSVLVVTNPARWLWKPV